MQLLDQIDTPTLTIGIREAAEITGRVLESASSEQTMLIQAGNQSVAVRTRMIGEHHIYNCLTAAAVALVQDIDLPTIARGLERAERIAGRLEAIQCGQPFGVFVDIAETPHQLAVALHALRQVTSGRIICVGTHRDRQSADDRLQVGRVIERAADRRILTSGRLSPELLYEPFHQMLDGFERPHVAQIVPDRIRAIEVALGEARPGDAVLISGCGERPFISVDGESWQLNDRDICHAWLYDHAFRDVSDEPNIYRIDDYR